MKETGQTQINRSKGGRNCYTTGKNSVTSSDLEKRIVAIYINGGCWELGGKISILKGVRYVSFSKVPLKTCMVCQAQLRWN